jgi:hypothetical protein
MARKENKGGNLHNEDIERELRTRGGSEKTGRSYAGSQDTGDDTVRPMGTSVQQADGLTPDELQEGEVRGNRDPE